MKPKMKIKMGIDLLMTVLLVLLMSYQITGQELHEWFGSAILVIFLVHNILNIRWYGSLFKGKYSLLRILQTIVNFSVLIAILCLGYSGIVLSRHVFAMFSIQGPMATARIIHLVASYWGFVLMSIHLGLHWNMILVMFQKGFVRCTHPSTKEIPVWLVWLIRLAAIGIAGYGAFTFFKKNILSYMFLQNQFVFFDFQQNAALVFLEYVAIMGFWIFVSYYLAKSIRSRRK